MRHATSSNRRSRGRNNNNNNRGRGGGNNRMQVFDSNGPDVRIRGTAHQICEKYAALAKDARSVGDLVLVESYLQHAEHYQRIISAWNEQNRVAQPSPEKACEADGNNAANGANNPTVAKETEDLSLPASILGGEVNVPSEAVRAPAGALEDA